MNPVLSRLSADVLISSPIRSSGMVFTPFLVSTVLVEEKHFFAFFVVVFLVVVGGGLVGGGLVGGSLVGGGLLVGSD